MGNVVQTIEVPFGYYAQFLVPTATDANNNPATVKAETADIDQPTLAYVAVGGGQVAVVAINPSSFAAGSKTVVTVSFDCEAADGTPLPEVQAQVTFDGPPLPPEATQIVLTAGGLVQINANGSNVPANPSENPLPLD